MMVFVGQLIFPIKKAERHSQGSVELEKNLNSALNIITYNIRQADSINSISGSDLSLKMPDSSIDPTVFSLSSNTIYIQQGTGSQIAITSDKVSVDTLTFEEISNPSPAKPSIKITITAHYSGPGSVGPNPVSKTVTTAATLR